MQKTISYKGKLFKIAFTGDSITPIYRIRMYRPRKFWLNEFLWEEKFGRSQMGSTVEQALQKVLDNYNREIQYWRSI